MKVLIISHNSLSPKHSIGKTLISLFSCFDKNELCQLYIHGSDPLNIGTSFFRITDKDALKGIFTRKVNGIIVSPQKDGFENTSTKSQKKYFAKNKANLAIELARDFTWKLSPWYNKKLKEWITEQKPTCIFVAIGSGKFLYKMAIKISKEFNLPIYTYICDDFYFMKKPKQFLAYHWKRSLDKSLKELLSNTTEIISICDDLSEVYGNEFKRKAKTIMTGTSYKICTECKINQNVKNINYFGKVTLNRWKSLLDIAKILDKINNEQKSNLVLNLYCGEVEDYIKIEFNKVESCKLHGFISGDKFKNKFFDTDILIHVESFDSEYMERVKYSVSTKIADSLSSGIPLLAYGPENVASIKYLEKNDAACVVTSFSDLKDSVQNLILDEEYRKKLSSRELSTAEKYHNPEKVSRELYNVLL